MNDAKDIAQRLAYSRAGALLTIMTIALLLAAGFYAGVQSRVHWVCP